MQYKRQMFNKKKTFQAINVFILLLTANRGPVLDLEQVLH